MEQVSKQTNEWLNNQINYNNERREEQQEAELYFRGKNASIMNRIQYTIGANSNGDPMAVQDLTKSNIKLPSNYFRPLVWQKVNYSINSGMVCTVNGTDIEQWIGRGWRDSLRQVAERASVKKFGAWQFYLDSQKRVKWKSISPEQVIPCYDADGELQRVQRVYQYTDDLNKTWNVLEDYTSETWSKYQQQGSDNWQCVVDKAPHNSLVTQVGSFVETQPHPWGRVPFAIFRNNEYFDSDLTEGLQNLIDAYDFTMSDWANDLSDYGEMYVAIKNYDGESIQEFLQNYKAFKVIKTDSDGGVDFKTVEIPYMAKTEFLNRLRNDIFLAGMGVDTASVEGNVTNVRIKAMYDNLDKKATQFEDEVVLFLKQVAYFYLKASGTTYPDFESIEVDIEFSRKLVINESEMIQNANNSVGKLSEVTRLAMYPNVNDPEAEHEAMEQDNAMRLMIPDPVQSASVRVTPEDEDAAE